MTAAQRHVHPTQLYEAPHRAAVVVEVVKMMQIRNLQMKQLHSVTKTVCIYSKNG